MKKKVMIHYRDAKWNLKWQQSGANDFECYQSQTKKNYIRTIMKEMKPKTIGYIYKTYCTHVKVLNTLKWINSASEYLLW